MSLAPFDRGIDFAALQLPTIDDPAKYGARFVMRYSAGAGNSISATQWKLCGLNELQDLVAAGYDFIANSEWYESRVEEGAAAGHEDGVADLAFWQARGLAQGASIYVSWDTGQPNPGKHPAVAEYLSAYEAAMGGYYKADLYAGDVAIAAMLEAGVIRYGWRAMADSWSSNGQWYMPGQDWRASAEQLAAVSPAHLVQNGNRWYNGGADEDVVMRLPVGSHLEALGDTPPAPAGPPRPDEAPAPVPAPAGVYEAVRGDSMSAIAAAHGMSLAELERLNPHAGHPAGSFNVIWPGDKFAVAGDPAAEAAPAETPVHIVQPGDSLSAIAAGWGVSLAAVEAANPDAGHPAGNFDVIWPGDSIVRP